MQNIYVNHLMYSTLQLKLYDRIRVIIDHIKLSEMQSVMTSVQFVAYVPFHKKHVLESQKLMLDKIQFYIALLQAMPKHFRQSNCTACHTISDVYFGGGFAAPKMSGDILNSHTQRALGSELKLYMCNSW